MDTQLSITHAAMWRAYDELQELRKARAVRHELLVGDYVAAFMAGEKPGMKMKFSDSAEAAALETDGFEAAICELSRRHLAALPKQVEADQEIFTAAKAEKQEQLLADHDPEHQRILDGDINTLASKFRDCRPVNELHATPDGIMQAARANPYIPASPIELERLLSRLDKNANVRIALDLGMFPRLWDGKVYKR